MPGSEVLATVTTAFVDPEVGRSIGSHFAAIHSDPPALRPGPDPAVVVHSFGKGKRKGPYVEFKVDPFEVFQMAILEYM